MKIRSMMLLIILVCNANVFPIHAAETTEPEILTIYPDGTMVFRGRVMNEDEVIIYPDGRGGEKAAVRVWEPLRPTARKDSKYYRDTIVVDRVDTNVERSDSNQIEATE